MPWQSHKEEQNLSVISTVFSDRVIPMLGFALPGMTFSKENTNEFD